MMSSSEELTEHAARNRASWDADAANWVDLGERAWASAEPSWGIWSIPESEVGFLSEVEGLDVVELGCGTGYVSSWVARRDGRPVGVDPSTEQLTYRELQARRELIQKRMRDQIGR